MTVFVNNMLAGIQKLCQRSNRLGCQMVCVLIYSVVDREFDPQQGQVKDFKIGICWQQLFTYIVTYRLRWMSYKKQELLTLRDHLSSPPVYWWGPCCSSFQFFLCYPIMCFNILSFAVFLFICLRIIYPILPVSLDCPFLIDWPFGIL